MDVTCAVHTLTETAREATQGQHHTSYGQLPRRRLAVPAFRQHAHQRPKQHAATCEHVEPPKLLVQAEGREDAGGQSAAAHEADVPG